MPRTKMEDLIVLVPGIMGSVLSKNGRDVWALEPGALLRGLVGLGRSIQDLALANDPIDIDCLDGVRAERLMPDAHLIPGFWKIDGYSQISAMIRERFAVTSGENYFEFPYDWRRDNRVAARQLGVQVHQWLTKWRDTGNKGAKLIFLCHSMGGLVARHFLELDGGWKDTAMMITFGTPFRGSLKALDFLANGLPIGALGVTVKNFGPTLRTFTSIYQLLPTYECYDPDGSKQLVSLEKVGSVPNLDMAKVRDAACFHKKMDDAASQRGQHPSQYVIHPVVGIEQPTFQSACLSGGKVTLLQSRGGEDEGGDGTVPRISATPAELRGRQAEVYAAECHGSLQNGDDVLRQIYGILSGLEIDRRELRAVQGAAVSLQVEDLYAAGQRVLIRARSGDPTAILDVTVANADSGETLPRQTMKDDGDGWMSADFGTQPEGVYRVTVNGSGITPVNDLFTVLK